MEGKLGQHHAGELRRETAEAKGGRIVAEELLRLGWSESELMLRRKNDPDKMGIAVRLRRETTLSIKDIAARVHLGTSNTANVRLHSAMKDLGGAWFEPKVRWNINGKRMNIWVDPLFELTIRLHKSGLPSLCLQPRSYVPWRPS